MFCVECGKKLDSQHKYCANCGTPIKEKKEKTASSENKFKHKTTIESDGEKVKVNYSNKAKNIVGKFILAIFLASIIGVLTYPISNQVQGINETEASEMSHDFLATYNWTGERDNVAHWKSFVKSRSYDHAKIVGFISFIVLLGYFFLSLENTDKSKN